MKCNVLGKAKNDNGGKEVFLKRRNSLCGGFRRGGCIFTFIGVTHLLSILTWNPY